MRLYDSMTKEPRDIPLGSLSVYTCGVTVYDYCHLGHARCYLVWDILRRWLAHSGRKVKYAQNFTDVDDKIIERAVAAGVPYLKFVSRYIDAYFEDMDWLGVMRADVYPRVSEYLPDMADATEQLVRSGCAHKTHDGVRFNPNAFPDYGTMSGRGPCEDFAVWKRKKGEAEFPEGRPGWHLECSVMIQKVFGGPVDIHCGGSDLMFPHHENEIAQSSCLYGHCPARHWMHNGFVMAGSEKMSKSSGTGIYIRDLRERGYDPNAIRYWVLQAGYRKPLTTDNLFDGSSGAQWAGLREKLRTGPEKGVHPDFVTAMDDDMNTPMALAVLHAYPSWEAAGLLGLTKDSAPPPEVVRLAEERAAFRKARDFAASDRMRGEIRKLGWEVRDKSGGYDIEKL